MRREAIIPVFALLLSVSRQSVSAQSLTSSNLKDTERTDPGRITRRPQWFRRGRQGVRGKAAAALRLDGYQQMLIRRKALNAARLSIAPIAGAALIQCKLLLWLRFRISRKRGVGPSGLTGLRSTTQCSNRTCPFLSAPRPIARRWVGEVAASSRRDREPRRLSIARYRCAG